MTNHVTFIYMLGWGGQAFETAGGAALLRQKVNALHGTYCPQLLQYTDQNAAAQYIREANSAEKIMLVGDSCGANRISWVAAMVAPRKIDYMFAIQASVWCNLNCPPVPANVEEFVNVYGGAQTFGLGEFCPPLHVLPPNIDTTDPEAPNYLYNGKTYIGNNGKTKCTYKFVDAPHPDDWDVENVHNPIITKAKALING